MMPIFWERTEQEKAEVQSWVEQNGPVTKAVREAVNKNSLTFGAAFITRQDSGNFKNN